MVSRTPWLERKFNFDYPVGVMPYILGRLRGTLPRVKGIIADVPEELLSHRIGTRWSIKEQVGHLIMVEALHYGRLDDFDAGAETLRPADRSALPGIESDYIAQSMPDILKRLGQVREEFIARMEVMDEAAAGRSALHPRLQQQMRVVDNALFCAEHDDHHIVDILELASTHSR